MGDARKGLLSRADSGSNKPRLSVSIPGVGMGEERGNGVVMSNGEEMIKDEPEGIEEDLDEDDVSFFLRLFVLSSSCALS